MLIFSQNKELMLNLENYTLEIRKDGLKYLVVASQINGDTAFVLGAFYSMDAAKDILKTIYRIYGGASKYEMPEE